MLVFNKHDGKHEDLAFDLRHKGGGLDFDLEPDASKGKIEEQRRALKDALCADSYDLWKALRELGTIVPEADY